MAIFELNKISMDVGEEGILVGFGFKHNLDNIAPRDYDVRLLPQNLLTILQRVLEPVRKKSREEKAWKWILDSVINEDGQTVRDSLQQRLSDEHSEGVPEEWNDGLLLRILEGLHTEGETK